MANENNGIIAAEMHNSKVLAPDSDLAREWYNKSRYGEPYLHKKFQYSLPEALYLMEKERMYVYINKKKLDFDSFVKKAKKHDPNFLVRYAVLSELRNRGYIVKTALKFGADLRVYDRGVKPGEDHAKWVVFPVHEGQTLTWYEFAAKNRVAHSTKKRLLMAIVDDENEVTFYEVNWVRP